MHSCELPNVFSVIMKYTFAFQLQPNSAAGSGALEHDSCCLYRPVPSVSAVTYVKLKGLIHM